MEQYGKEWEKEVLRNPKIAMVQMLRHVGKERARLQRIEAAARPALEELKALHDEWNKSLELDCVGETICTTAQIINALSAALEAK